MKSGGSSFVKAFAWKTAFDYFASDDIDPLVRVFCWTYATIFWRNKCKYLVYVCVLTEHVSTVPHEFHQTLNFNDVRMNLEQEQLTIPNSISITNLKLDLLGEKEEIQLKRSGWRYLRIKSINFNLSRSGFVGGSSFDELPINHRSIWTSMLPNRVL